jgi:hypothetical protein
VLMRSLSGSAHSADRSRWIPAVWFRCREHGGGKDRSAKINQPDRGKLGGLLDVVTVGEHADPQPGCRSAAQRRSGVIKSSPRRLVSGQVSREHLVQISGLHWYAHCIEEVASPAPRTEPAGLAGDAAGARAGVAVSVFRVHASSTSNSSLNARPLGRMDNLEA